MIEVLVQGRLRGDPAARTAKSGAAYATARLAVTDSDGQSHLVSVIAFEPQAVEALLALGDGDSVSMAGELGVGTYTTKTGETKPALRLTAHAILTPYHVRRKREAATGRRDGGTHAARTLTARAAALRAQQPLPDDDLDDLPL